MAELARFDTQGLDSQDGLARWGEFISQGPDRLRTEPSGGIPFAGSLAMATIGNLRLFHIEATPHRLEKPAGTDPSRDFLRIVIQARGRAILSQGGQDILLEPGNWAVWSTARAHVVQNLTDVEQFGLLIPMERIGIKLADILNQAGNRLGDRPGWGRMLPSHIFELFKQIESISPTYHADTADIVAHMVRLALMEYRASGARISMRDTMRDRVAEYVLHNLRDPEMSLAQIAAHFGCSKRNIHKVFSESKTTLSRFLWDERLERCHDALANKDFADCSITQIAFGWGFNSSTHFSKAFKAKFGMSPGAWRTSVLSPLQIPSPVRLAAIEAPGSSSL